MSEHGGEMLGRRRLMLPVSRDVLGLHKLEHALMAALTPETRLLNAPEGRGRIGNEPAIKANHSILQTLRYVEAALQITREDIGDQTIFRVVCPSDHILLAVKGLNGRYRSKDFLVHAVSPCSER